MTLSWIENPRVRGSIPRLATSEFKRLAHSSEWAFCYLAVVIGRCRVVTGVSSTCVQRNNTDIHAMSFADLLDASASPMYLLA